MVLRKRYYYWLLKAYFKKWGKIIFASVVLGGVIFLLLFLLITYFFLPSVSDDIERIGMTGSFTSANLPEEVLQDVSYGLTVVTEDQEVKKAAAASWKISDNGKKYTFTLKKGQMLSNGEELTSQIIPYRFKDVTINAPDLYTVEFTLKDPFAPFLSVVSRPILIRNTGLGEYKITKINQESGFVKSVSLQKRSENRKKIYYFYPTQEALKTAFQLGEIDVALGLPKRLQPSDFKNWKQTEISQETDYSRLVSLFFNTSNEDMGNKRLRQALLYALPETFEEGERTYSYIPPTSMYYAKSPNEGIHDLELSSSLLDASASAGLMLEISTPEELLSVAEKVKEAWKKIGVETTIRQITNIPDNYQVLLFTMNLPKDPDMYTLWHTGQPENLSHFSNVRIDKLLEDGRVTVNREERQAIYADVQKYLIDDSPSAFLYFPFEYTLRRK